MNFYKYFYCIMTFLALYLNGTGSLSNKNLIVMNTGVEPIHPSCIGLVLFADVNNTLEDVDFNVELKPDQCCLEVGSDELCNVMEIEGECVSSIRKGSSKTLRLVASLIEPIERRGYCIVYLDSKPKARQRKSMRDIIKIPFNTHVKNTTRTTELFGNISACSEIDEDPLNDCKPVDCETYYNGQRSFFDVKTKRCVGVPFCWSNVAYEVPNKIYDKMKNKCIDGASISESDLELVKKLSGTAENRRNKNRKTKDILIISSSVMVPKSKQYSATKNITKMLEHNYMPLFNSLRYKDIKGKGFMNLFSNFCINNQCTIYVLAAVVLVQCCLICMLVYCFSSSCPCGKKKIVKRFFNVQRDATVTTPLIRTSNVDTDTTEFPYFSETSNLNNKIKCYKAFQKEGLNNVKICMSDDILSKCITRRDWNSKPTRSEAIAGSTISDDNNLREILKKDTTKDGERISSMRYQTNSIESNRKSGNVKVNFENEQVTQKKEKKRNSVLKSASKKLDKTTERSHEDTKCGVSEMEIKCHSYKYAEDPNITGFKQTCSKRLEFFRADIKNVNDMSTEKGAQAAFSNDSLDDFLSERGVLFLAGDDLSKYSYSSQSNDAKASSLSSGMSSKTSKNNVVKNVLSLLHRKSNSGPSSDPGAKKRDENLNMEVLHMSTASVFSSNNESEYLKSLRQTKDSRTSL